MLLGHLTREQHAEAGATRARGVKRLPEARERGGVHAAPRVLDGEPGPRAVGRPGLRAWTLFGLADILTVFASAQIHLLVLRDPRMRALLDGLPFALLPVLVVPLVLMTHAALFAATSRYRQAQG